MAQNSLTDLMALINNQICSQETLVECLSKAQALIYVAIGNEFLDHEPCTIHDYLWALSDFIEQARSLSEHVRDALLMGTPPNNLPIENP